MSTPPGPCEVLEMFFNVVLQWDFHSTSIMTSLASSTSPASSPSSASPSAASSSSSAHWGSTKPSQPPSGGQSHLVAFVRIDLVNWLYIVVKEFEMSPIPFLPFPSVLPLGECQSRRTVDRIRHKLRFIHKFDNLCIIFASINIICHKLEFIPRILIQLS